jgi:hypothetical protein
VATEGLNIEYVRVANMSTCSGRTAVETLLSASDNAEHSRIRFVLFHIIMVDKIQSLVKKVCGTELDIVYRTAGFELDLFNKIR